MLRRTQYASARVFSSGVGGPRVTSATVFLTRGVHSQHSARSFCFHSPTVAHEAKVEQAICGSSSSYEGRGVSQVNVARLDFNDCSGRLVNAGLVESQLLVKGIEADAAKFAEFFDALARAGARDLVCDGFDSAVGVEEMRGSRIEDASRRIVE